MDELGTVRTSKIRFQGSAIGGNPSDNDWRIEVVNEGLQFQQYDPGASPAGYVTRQIFGRGKTGVTVTPSSTYNISGKLKLSGSLLLQELPHQSTISSYANLYPFKDDNKLYYLHPDFNNGEPYDLTRPNEIGNLDTGINIHSINSVNENIITTTNGKERMRILHTGNIGIGISNPTEILDINGNIKGNKYIQVYKVTVSSSKFLIDGISQKKISLQRGNKYIFDVTDISTNNFPFIITTSTTGGTSIGQYLTGVVGNGSHYGTSSNEVIFNVGDNAPGCLYYQCSNTENMGAKIEIIGSVIRDSDDDTKIIIEEELDDDKIHLITKDIKRLTTLSNGNIGIGITTPNEKLEINGNVRINGKNSGYTTIQTDPNSNNIIYTLPKELPTENKFLKTSTSGKLTWDSVGESNIGNNLNKSGESNNYVYKNKTDNNLNFRSLIGGDNVNLLSETNSITISTDSKSDEIYKNNSKVIVNDDGSSNKKVEVFVDGKRNMVVKSNMVGIGITNPLYSLHVLGNIKIEGSITTTGSHDVVTTSVSSTEHLNVNNAGTFVSGIFNQTGSKDIAHFRLSNNNKVKILNSGNVAIGQETANEKLEINGAIKLDNHESSTPDDGIIEYNTTTKDFLGRKDGQWISLTVQGEKNTVSNIGASGIGLYDSKLGDDIRIKKLEAGNFINITESNNNTVVIGSTTHNKIINGTTQIKINNTDQEFIVSNTELMKLNSVGLGINKTSNFEKLEINGGINLGNASGTENGTIEYDSTLNDFMGRRNGRWISLTHSNQIVLNDTNINITDTGSNGLISFKVDNLQKMRINSTGVGIDVLSNKEKLEVNGAIKIGTTTTISPDDGVIKYDTNDFIGRKNGEWVSLTTPSITASNIGTIGIGVFDSIVNNDFRFRNLVAGNGIVINKNIINNENSIQIGLTDTNIVSLTIRNVDKSISLKGPSILEFDQNSGFNLTKPDSNSIRVSLGSHWKDINVDGQTTLSPTGEESLKIIAGNNIVLNTNPSSLPQSLTISANHPNQIVLNDTSISINDTGNNGTLDFKIDNTSLMKINSNGVGINTESLKEKLEINGAIKVGTTSTSSPDDGVIKYANNDFLGRKDGSWVSLTSIPNRSSHTNKSVSHNISSNYGNFDPSNTHVVLSDLNFSLAEGDHYIFFTWTSIFTDSPLDDQLFEVYYKDGAYSSNNSASDGILLRKIYRSNIVSDSHTNTGTIFLNVPGGKTYNIRFTRGSIKRYRWGNNIGDIKEDSFSIDYVTPIEANARTNLIYKNTSNIEVNDSGGNNDIIFTTNSQESMRIISNGYIGIGNTSPSVPLHVTSFKNQSYSGTKVDGLSSTYTVRTGILCDNDCIANNFYYNSDKRIKKEITENNMKNSLEKINMLESVNYKYHNDKKMVGFIGQNVRKVIPEAVSFSEQYVYTIDKMIKFRNYQGRTLMTFDSSHGLNNNRMHGELVQPLTLMMKFNNLIKYIGVNVILSDRDVLLDVNLETEYNIEKEVYVAGPKIKDFHVINEQPIISMCVSAIQELTEQCKELQETNRLLINEINSLKSFN